MTAVTRLRVSSSDSVELEAERADPDCEPRAAVLLCHPHPQFGGSMHAGLIASLFDALPASGLACLRFDFRGVGASTGRYDQGRGERDDAAAALGALVAASGHALPIVVAGWSFGADVALSTTGDAVSGWFAVAPPMRFTTGLDALASDARPKLLVLAEHDQFRAPAAIAEATSGWLATERVVVPGADHFFVDHATPVVDAARRFVARVVEARPARAEDGT